MSAFWQTVLASEDEAGLPEVKHSERPMIHRLAAELVLLIHFVFVLLAVLGALGILIAPGWVWIHLPIVIWSAVVNLAGWTCPLTPLENRLRATSGGVAYAGGCVQHYLGPLVYPMGMPRRMERIAGVSILLWNGLLYGSIFWWRHLGTAGA